MHNSFSNSLSKAENIFGLVHRDLWGPYRQVSLCDSFYFLTIVDDCSGIVSVYLLARKSEHCHIFEQFYALIKTQFNKTTKSVRTDNGINFMCLTPFFLTHGIFHRLLWSQLLNKMVVLRGNINTF